MSKKKGKHGCDKPKSLSKSGILDPMFGKAHSEKK